METLELTTFITDICRGSVLTAEEAYQLWKVLGNKRKMWAAAEDANSRGFSTVLDFATVGVYNEISVEEQISSLVAQFNSHKKQLVLAYVKGLNQGAV